MFRKREPKEKPVGPRIKSSYVWAFVIFVVVAGWMASGQLDRTTGPQKLATNVEEPSGNKLFTVRGVRLEAKAYTRELNIRGRTAALRNVQVRAETSGTIAELPIEKGTKVVKGDILCQLDIDARGAQMAEAQALMTQRKLEWQASDRLAKQGHRSKTQAAASKAAFEAANANFRLKEIELERTKIRAPFDGIFNERNVEVGDFIQPGQSCGAVVDEDPFLVVAEVSERDVVRLRMGDPGSAQLISGEELEGKIRFISSSSSPETRTFRVELEIANPDGVLRDGVTADVSFPLNSVSAHLVSPAILGLDADGTVGVRTVSDEGIVSFAPVEIVSDTMEGVWISGLPDTVTIITVGQELVAPGQKVKVILQNQAGY